MVSSKPGLKKIKKASVHKNVKIQKQKENKTMKSSEKLKTKVLKTVKSDEQFTDDKNKSFVLLTVQDENKINKKKVKSTMPTKYVTEKIVDSCLNALDQLAACTKNKNAILEDEQQIFAEIHCIKIQSRNGNVKFVLPHSTAASTGEICLITPDIKKGRKIDHEPTVDRWEEILRKANVTSVKTVLPLRQLKVEYDQYELKRRLLTQHDLIMVDTRVINHASHLLGKMFFKKHNMLIPVRLNENGTNLKKSLDVGLRTAMLRLSQGPTSVILVGHTGMPKEKLKENVLSLVQQLREKFPGGEANIRSLSLKLPLSLSLPLYLTLRSSHIVNPPKLNKKKPKNFTFVEDELSTMPNSTVRVAPDGTISLKKIKNSMMEEEVEEEESDEDQEIDNEED